MRSPATSSSYRDKVDEEIIPQHLDPVREDAVFALAEVRIQRAQVPKIVMRPGPW